MNTARPQDLSALLAEMQSAGDQPAEVYTAKLLVQVRGLAHQALNPDDRLRLVMDSEDLAQDALMQLVRTVHRFRGTTWAEFFGFVRRVLSQQAVDHARHHGCQKRDPDPAELVLSAEGRMPPTPSDLVVAGEQEQRLRELIGQLPELLRRSLGLRLAGKDYAEIARDEGISLANARQRISRSLRLLQEKWRL